MAAPCLHFQSVNAEDLDCLARLIGLYLKKIRRLILLDFSAWYLTGVALPLTIFQLDYELKISIA